MSTNWFIPIFNFLHIFTCLGSIMQNKRNRRSKCVLECKDWLDLPCSHKLIHKWIHSQDKWLKRKWIHEGINTKEVFKGRRSNILFSVFLRWLVTFYLLPWDHDLFASLSQDNKCFIPKRTLLWSRDDKINDSVTGSSVAAGLGSKWIIQEKSIFKNWDLEENMRKIDEFSTEC